MKIEEAIKELSVLWERMKRAKESGVLAYKTIMYYDGQYVESLDMAIKALETDQMRIIKCLNTTCAYNDKYKCKSDEIVIDNGGDCMCQEEED